MEKRSEKEALIIINPASGRGIAGDKKLIADEAEKLGWNGKIRETTLKIGAGIIAQRAIEKGIKHIIACGGDGTVREVLEQAVRKDVVVGIVPLGTGNIFAKNMNLPLTIPEAVKIALQVKPVLVDAASANGHFFVLIAGMGLDVEAMDNTDQHTKNRWGMLAYLAAGLGAISKHSKKYRLVIDDKSEFIVKAKSVLVANIGKSEGGINIVPGANPESGNLMMGVIKANSLFSWLDLAFSALQGNINKSPSYDLYQGEKIECYPLNGPQTYECDGDKFPATEKLTIRIYPKSVKVLIS